MKLRLRGEGLRYRFGAQYSRAVVLSDSPERCAIGTTAWHQRVDPASSGLRELTHAACF